MEKKGYVMRQKMPDNKKQIRVFLTPMGLQLKQVMVPEAENINAQALSGLTPQDIHVTRRTLLAMVDNLKRDPLNQTATSPVQDDHGAQDASENKDFSFQPQTVEKRHRDALPCGF